MGLSTNVLYRKTLTTLPALKKWETANQVFKTSDYSILKGTSENRELKPNVVKALKESFSEKYIPNPIIVNEALQIIDGHNRKAAAEALGLPIYFVIVPGLTKDDIIRLNVNRQNWSTDDYLKYYIGEGKEDYIILKQFRDKYKLSICDCVGIMLGLNSKANNDHMKEFHGGGFTIKDHGRAIQIAEKILQVKPFYSRITRKSFVGAMLFLFKNPNYNHDEFLSKLEYQQTALVDCSSAMQYVDVIEKIYNYRRRGGLVNLRF
jgi:hypothetical protein